MLVGWDDFQGFCGPPNNRPCPRRTRPASPATASRPTAAPPGPTAARRSRSASPRPPATPWVDRGGEDGDEVFYYTSRMRTGVAGSAGIGVHRGHFAAGTFVWDDAQLLARPTRTTSTAGSRSPRPRTTAAPPTSCRATSSTSCGFPAGGYGQIEVFRTHDNGDTWQGRSWSPPTPARRPIPTIPSAP